jgi:hypothetical protein
LWSLVLAGWIAAAAVRESTEVKERETAPQAQPLHPRALSQLSARELRVLPGLGEKRSLALVDARWERAPGDPPLLLGDLAGIGGVVESAVRSALASGSMMGGSMDGEGAFAEAARAAAGGELDSR